MEWRYAAVIGAPSRHVRRAGLRYTVALGDRRNLESPFGIGRQRFWLARRLRGTSHRGWPECGRGNVT